VTWHEGDPIGLDLYYDPIVDEHVGQGPIGIIAPTWYFAPQRPEVARAGWQMAAMLNGVTGDGPITGLNDPARAVTLLQFAGEFADPATKKRIWEAADEHIEANWDRKAGEFTLGFRLDEPHPRGQWNARVMAGWVCTPGAWARIFNEPNLGKFEEPTVEGVDFPRVALSEARWDGSALHLAAHPQNPAIEGSRTKVRITNVAGVDDWVMSGSNGETIALSGEGNHVNAELVVDNQAVVIRRHSSTM
jgi:hypothetical protein